MENNIENKDGVKECNSFWKKLHLCNTPKKSWLKAAVAVIVLVLVFYCGVKVGGIRDRAAQFKRVEYFGQKMMNCGGQSFGFGNRSSFERKAADPFRAMRQGPGVRATFTPSVGR